MTKKNKALPRKRSDKGDIFVDDPLVDKIGKSLRSMYKDVLDEPVPDAFLDLLKQADSDSGRG